MLQKIKSKKTIFFDFIKQNKTSSQQRLIINFIATNTLN